MSEVIKKQVCECKSCGNEAEMTITCHLADEKNGEKTNEKKETPPAKEAGPEGKIKGSAVCSHCGNEADMWIDM